MTKNYRVSWEIDVHAESPEDAAQQARKIQLDPSSIANVFDTVDEDANIIRVDLQEIIEKAR